MGKPTTIYFDINDAQLFKALNPGERRIDHILMGLPQNKKKAWYIKLDNGLNRFEEIYFSQKDADTFNNKMNQSLPFRVG